MADKILLICIDYTVDIVLVDRVSFVLKKINKICDPTTQMHLPKELELDIVVDHS